MTKTATHTNNTIPEPRKRPAPMDAEVRALNRIAAELKELSVEAQARVLTWIASRVREAQQQAVSELANRAADTLGMPGLMDPRVLDPRD